MKALHRMEDMAVRVMYFFNVIDTFLPFSVILYLAASRGIWTDHGLLSGAFFLSLPVFFLLLIVCFLIAEYHVFYLAGLPVILLAGFFNNTLDWSLVRWTLLFFFIVTGAVQILFMGLPMGVAARSPFVPLRMFLNSFVILAPTTISLPVTLGFQLFTAAGLATLVPRPLSLPSLLAVVLLLALAVAVRKVKKGPAPQPAHHPAPGKKQYNRAILLNIDGLSHHVFSRARAPFLHALERDFLHAPRGAATVYKAFTNPAFASILTGAEPAVHGVVNNNFGQAIRAQALPDIMPARLYGSMHVKHFSRPSWRVEVVSLVAEGYDRADALLLEKLKADLEKDRDTALWLVDFSLADFCGHAWGGYSKRYYGAVEKLDGLIAGFFSWCRDKGLADDTLFILSSDHGLFIGEHAYGLSDREKYVPLVFAGSGVPQGEIEGPASILDIAANLCFCLNRPYPSSSGGRVFAPLQNPLERKRGVP